MSVRSSDAVDERHCWLASTPASAASCGSAAAERGQDPSQAVTAALIWVEHRRVLKGGSVMANGLAEKSVRVGEMATVMGLS
jgi:hypothetical protein